MNAANFETSIHDQPVELFHIFSQSISCFITNYGARVVSLSTFDKDSRKVDIILGFDSIDGYTSASEKYHGASIGRYANRIANGDIQNLNGNIHTIHWLKYQRQAHFTWRSNTPFTIAFGHAHLKDDK